MARDDEAIDDLVARLAATDQFGVVYAGADPKTQPAPADATTAAWIRRNQTREDCRFGADSPLRTVEFLIYVAAVDEDPAERLRTIARLEAVIIDNFQGKSLGGFTFPNMTKFDRGRDEKSLEPQSLYSIRGEFTYLPNDDTSGAPDARDEGSRSGGDTSTPVPAAAAGGYGGSAAIGAGYGQGGYGL